jgi:Thiamine pyrophosphate enzyme, N-terminal TPP binding domain/Aldehyde dehydrogenase family
MIVSALPQRSTGAERIVEALDQLGVTVAFGLPSVHNLPIWQALSRSKVRLIGVRHEQTAVYAADGYVRTGGSLGFHETVNSGMVSINNSTSGAEAHLPFGGNGKSGNGSRQSGVWVLDQFTRWQGVNWDYAGQLQRAQMDVSQIEADRDFRL